MAQPSFVRRSYANAQELNQSAALFIGNEQYDRAISNLKTALQLWKQCSRTDENSENDDGTCLCPLCNPNGCSPSETDDEETNVPRIFDHQLRAVNDDDGCESGFNGGYLHKKLVLIPCIKQFGSHNMDSGVALIIIFNLAIAHHVRASRLSSRPMMKRTLHLYQLANECLLKYVTDSLGCSASDEIGILFQIILLNNLSHLHAFLGDELKSRKCVEQVIPIIMCVVDDKVRNVECWSVEIRHIVCLEGFFQNISPIVLKSQCADAA
jgi:hypothetical protein